MHTPGRGEGALRRQRASLPNTSYFLTLCTQARHEGLTRNETALAIKTEIAAIEADGHWTQRAAVLMPDHLHLLVCVSGLLPLPRCIARLKSKTRSALLSSSLTWQPNFYEHRLRPEDPIEDVVRYIFLNPYRVANLVPGTARYPWFWLGTAEEIWFKPSTDEGRPFPEWLR